MDVSRLVIIATIAASSAPAAADDRGAFCEVTPCLPGPVTRQKLAADRPAGGLVCKKGEELGEDSNKRIVFCTTARAAMVDGMSVAANAYTLFHPSGKIYQTHLRAPLERVMADGKKVTCGADVIALDSDGTVSYCRLSAKLAITPRPRVGEGISFHPGGRVAGTTTSRSTRS